MTTATRHVVEPTAAPTITRIVVAVDGSNHAAKAIDMAADLAVRYGASLTIVHAMPEEGSYTTPIELQDYARIEHVTPTEHDLLEGKARRLLSDMATRAGKGGVRGAETVVEVGDPSKVILEVAAQTGADLLVLGSRGLGPVRSLLGSVSQRVAHQAPCTVITVK